MLSHYSHSYRGRKRDARPSRLPKRPASSLLNSQRSCLRHILNTTILRTLDRIQPRLTIGRANPASAQCPGMHSKEQTGLLELGITYKDDGDNTMQAHEHNVIMICFEKVTTFSPRQRNPPRSSQPMFDITEPLTFHPSSTTRHTSSPLADTGRVLGCGDFVHSPFRNHFRFEIQFNRPRRRRSRARKQHEDLLAPHTVSSKECTPSKPELRPTSITYTSAPSQETGQRLAQREAPFRPRVLDFPLRSKQVLRTDPHIKRGCLGFNAR